MHDSETFARILSAREEPPSARAKVVAVEEWTRPRLAAESPAVVRPVSQIPDMLDSAFVDFHRGLKEYMMDTYGLMGSSEAIDLHTVVARHTRLADPDAPA